MSILAIRCNRRQEKISMSKLHNSMNILQFLLHIPINAKLYNIEGYHITSPNILSHYMALLQEARQEKIRKASLRKEHSVFCSIASNS